MAEDASPEHSIRDILKGKGVPTPSSDAYEDGIKVGRELANDLEAFAKEMGPQGSISSAAGTYADAFRAGLAEGVTQVIKNRLRNLESEIDEWEWADANASHEVESVWSLLKALRIGALIVGAILAISASTYYSEWVRWGIVVGLIFFGSMPWLPKEQPSAGRKVKSLRASKPPTPQPQP